MGKGKENKGSQPKRPKKQQNVSNAWRKHEEQQKQQNGAPFGYVPFKSAPLPIYGIRGSTLATGNAGAQRTQQILNPAEYMHSTYAPPQALRPESAMVPRETGNLPQRGGIESRPDLPSKMPSRYQSYTTLPRPEHVEVDGDFQQHNFHPLPLPLHNSREATIFMG
uniref:Uncharacterized protein n=1 Tax=Ditylenchus dipsaci TaxID=166011 RepID=A0A915DAS3_9BILA